jgi:monoamine oxidase
VFAPRAKSAAKTFGLTGDQTWSHYADCTTDRIVREAQRQLSEVEGIEVPEPYAAASKNWTVDPFGGALNMWRIGVRSESLMPKITRPLPDLPVYVCGEAYSRVQGWVEGALQTAELMLQQHFGLKRPGWLQGDV